MPPSKVVASGLVIAFAAQAVAGESSGTAILDHGLHIEDYIPRPTAHIAPPSAYTAWAGDFARVLGIPDFPPDDHM